MITRMTEVVKTTSYEKGLKERTERRKNMIIVFKNLKRFQRESEDLFFKFPLCGTQNKGFNLQKSKLQFRK